MNLSALCLKGMKMKAPCFGHFFESHISVSSYIHKILVGFFLLHASQRTKKDRGKADPPLQHIYLVFLILVTSCIREVVILEQLTR